MSAVQPLPEKPLWREEAIAPPTNNKKEATLHFSKFKQERKRQIFVDILLSWYKVDVSKVAYKQFHKFCLE